jgi:tetratricopeptide (TPR) repeat protein
VWARARDGRVAVVPHVEWVDTKSELAMRDASEGFDRSTPDMPEPVQDFVDLSGENEDPRVVGARRQETAGHVQQAVDLYRQVLLDRPRDAAVRMALGRLYDGRGEPQLALEQFEAARDAAPDSVEVLVQHANALAGVGRFDAAERELRRALKMEPTRPEVHGSLGIINFRRGKYNQAEQELKRAIELDPESPAAFHYRGESLNQLGRVDEALSMLERAAQLAPAHARTFYVMGIVFDKKGRPQEAAAMYRKAREIAAA